MQAARPALALPLETYFFVPLLKVRRRLTLRPGGGFDGRRQHPMCAVGSHCMIKPRRLVAGDVVAVVSPSWGGPGRFPDTFAAGLKTLEGLGLTVREYPATRALNASVPERVADLHAAFFDPDVKAIVAAIGGDDSVRLLPYLDAERIRNNAKIVLGYSDTTTLLTFLVHHGIVAFHGPSVMAGLAQAAAFPAGFLDGLKAILFDAAVPYEFGPFSVCCDGYENWTDAANAARPKPLRRDSGPRTVLGRGVVRGRLWGGCLETLEMLKGTPWWPPPQAWNGTVLMIEGSENAPTPDDFRRALRSWHAGGGLERIAALIVGRARDYSDDDKAALEDAIATFMREEAGRPDLVVLANCDFGHTDPQWVLPLGCEVAVDAERARITLTEPAVR